MTQPEPYELVLTPPARRALTDRLPEAVATAVIDFLTTTLVETHDVSANRCGVTWPAFGRPVVVPTECCTDFERTPVR